MTSDTADTHSCTCYRNVGHKGVVLLNESYLFTTDAHSGTCSTNVGNREFVLINKTLAVTSATRLILALLQKCRLQRDCFIQ